MPFEQAITTTEFATKHHEFSTQCELHAELNAILNAAREGVSCIGSTMYTLYSPCIQCAKAIVAAGIRRVVYRVEYSRDTRGIEFLLQNGIAVAQK